MDKVKDLGVYLDSSLDMSTNTSMIIRSCHVHLHHISRINKFLPRKTNEKVVNALITSIVHGPDQISVPPGGGGQNFTVGKLFVPPL